ncbi:MAG: TMEM175 family protein [Ignavibacteria bacterium]|jgi:uncharacterized membrane protein|nr:DUF1211 domain-containing protein [Ignavibacteria bacterium]
MQRNRLEAFSDGVLAIIITIMVLEIKVPHGNEWNDLSLLLPKFISYVLSFLYIGIYWGNHHNLLHTAPSVNARVMLANLHLLFWLSLIPFTTGWMGENHMASRPVALYSFNLLMAGVAYSILQSTIQSVGGFHDKIATALKKHRYKGIISMISYLISIAFAFIEPIVSVVIAFVIAVMWLIPDKHIELALTKADLADN